MGKLISKCVFSPDNDVFINNHSNDVWLTTIHLSRIQVKFIKRQSNLYLLVSHGNAEDVSTAYEWALNNLLEYTSINVVIYEYTGYGENKEEFQCKEEYIYNDIDTVYNYMTREMQISPRQIILYGRSLGSGPCCYLAEKHKDIGGFTFPGDMFPNVDRIKHVECPTVIFHSVKDEIVPFYHGKELYQASKNKFDPLFIDGTTHNTNDGEIGIFYEHLNKFFNYINENNKVIV